uniref:Uncharacterized protein n=1 Tax=Lepeophtheirus salmonis TaxID=72036 RepID=A0A0K2T418_LEPSM
MRKKNNTYIGTRLEMSTETLINAKIYNFNDAESFPVVLCIFVVKVDYHVSVDTSWLFSSFFLNK